MLEFFVTNCQHEEQLFVWLPHSLLFASVPPPPRQLAQFWATLAFAKHFLCISGCFIPELVIFRCCSIFSPQSNNATKETRPMHAPLPPTSARRHTQWYQASYGSFSVKWRHECVCAFYKPFRLRYILKARLSLPGMRLGHSFSFLFTHNHIFAQYLSRINEKTHSLLTSSCRISLLNIKAIKIRQWLEVLPFLGTGRLNTTHIHLATKHQEMHWF